MNRESGIREKWEDRKRGRGEISKGMEGAEERSKEMEKVFRK
jgi:hypothetical protein